MVRKNKSESIDIASAIEQKNTFVGREDLIAAFKKVHSNFLQSLSNDSYNPCVLSFYGIGGIGKTSLIHAVRSDLKENYPDVASALIDFETDSFDMETTLRRIYGQLADVPGFDFPLYEFGRYLLDRKLGEVSRKSVDKGLLSWMNKNSAFGQFLALGHDIPIVGCVESIIKLAGAGVVFAQKIIDGYADDLKSLENADSNQLLDLLHVLMKKDLQKSMNKCHKSIVIFMDTFETAERKACAWLCGGVDEGKDWDENLEALVYLPNTMIVIAGRNELMWEKKDAGWKDFLTQVSVGKISYENTCEWFDQVGMSDPVLRESLYNLTEGVPLYINVCLLHYKLLERRGKNPTCADFGFKKEEMINRYFRNMEVDEQRSFFALACLKSWISSMLEHVGERLGEEFGVYLVVNYEERLKYNSFIVHVPDGVSYMHKIVGAAIACSQGHQYLKEPVMDSAVEFAKSFIADAPVTSELFPWVMKWRTEYLVQSNDDVLRIEGRFYEDLFKPWNVLIESCRFEAAMDIVDILGSKDGSDTCLWFHANLLSMKARVLEAKGFPVETKRTVIEAVEAYRSASIIKDSMSHEILSRLFWKTLFYEYERIYVGMLLVEICFDSLDIDRIEIGKLLDEIDLTRNISEMYDAEKKIIESFVKDYNEKVDKVVFENVCCKIQEMENAGVVQGWDYYWLKLQSVDEWEDCIRITQLAHKALLKETNANRIEVESALDKFRALKRVYGELKAKEFVKRVDSERLEYVNRICSFGLLDFQYDDFVRLVKFYHPLQLDFDEVGTTGSNYKMEEDEYRKLYGKNTIELVKLFNEMHSNCNSDDPRVDILACNLVIRLRKESEFRTLNENELGVLKQCFEIHLSCLNESLHRVESLYGKNHLETLDAEGKVFNWYKYNDRIPDAIKIGKRILEKSNEALGKTDVTNDCVNRVVMGLNALYRKSGDLENAAQMHKLKWRLQGDFLRGLWKLNEQVYGPTDPKTLDSYHSLDFPYSILKDFDGAIKCKMTELDIIRQAVNDNPLIKFDGGLAKCSPLNIISQIVRYYGKQNAMVNAGKVSSSELQRKVNDLVERNMDLISYVIDRNPSLMREMRRNRKNFRTILYEQIVIRLLLRKRPPMALDDIVASYVKTDFEKFEEVLGEFKIRCTAPTWKAYVKQVKKRKMAVPTIDCVRYSIRGRKLF